MSVMEVTTRITHRYLMTKTKSELAFWILDQIDELEKLDKQLKAEKVKE